MAVVGMSTQKALETRLADICGHLNALHGQLVELMVEVLEAGAWQGGGIHSPAHWLAWQSGLSPSRARQIVALAQRHAQLPVTFAALTAGELAVDQVAVVASHAPDRCDQEACELAKAATVSQLRSVLSKYRFDPAPAEDSAAAPVEPGRRDHCVSGYDDDGRFILHAGAPAAEGAIIDQALREAHDALFRAGHKDVTQLDALIEVCTRSMGAIKSPSRRSLFKIHVHVDTEGAWLHHGPALPAHVRDRILCDGVLVPVWETEGRPINTGRAARAIPEQTRIAVQNRDRRCRNPICQATRRLEIHHVLHWLQLGPGETWNLACLCTRCHDAHHRGEFTITGNADLPDGLTFRDRAGRIMHPGARANPPNQPPEPPPKPYAHPTGERLQPHWMHFNTG
jgi:Domain of unknown function (DUF222)/HNH endonuclease